VNENWGLTEAGFLRPSYTELLDALEVKAKELFGSSVNLSVRSPLGIFLRIFAWFAGMLWQLAEQVYNSGFVDTATGISLARLGAFIGIRLLAAQKAAGMLQITGEAGASVYAGFLVQARNNQRFVTLEDAVIGEGGTVSVPIQAYEAGPEGNVDAGAIDEVRGITATPQGTDLLRVTQHRVRRPPPRGPPSGRRCLGHQPRGHRRGACPRDLAGVPGTLLQQCG